jgi:hypothetical protein
VFSASGFIGKFRRWKIIGKERFFSIKWCKESADFSETKDTIRSWRIKEAMMARNVLECEKCGWTLTDDQAKKMAAHEGLHRQFDEYAQSFVGKAVLLSSSAGGFEQHDLVRLPLGVISLVNVIVSYDRANRLYIQTVEYIIQTWHSKREVKRGIIQMRTPEFPCSQVFPVGRTPLDCNETTETTAGNVGQFIVLGFWARDQMRTLDELRSMIDWYSKLLKGIESPGLSHELKKFEI